MRREETELLAQELVHGLEPVTVIPRLRWVALAIGLVGLAAATPVIALTGLRPDVRALEAGLPYAGVIGGLLAFATGGVLAALAASVPGRRAMRVIGLATIAVAFAVWVPAGLGLAAAGQPVGPVDRAWLGVTAYCLGIATLVGVLPALALARWVARAFAFRPGPAVALGASAVAAFGSCAVHLTCLADEVLHIGVGHVFGPLAIGAGVGLLLWRLTPRRAP